MRKIVIAVLCAIVLLVSIAAAQVALPTGIKAADLTIAKSTANAFGLAADKSQCTCSADTLAKIAQIKKLLAELEQSCSAVVPVSDNSGKVPVPTVTGTSCVDKCMAEEGKPYCEKACVEGRGVGQLDSEGNVIQKDEECLAGCTASMKQKCENGCNMPQPVDQQPGCIDTCMANNYDKAGCLSGCSAEDINNDGPCYKACQDKANEVYGMCQKDCVGKEPTSNEAPKVLNQCSSSCEVKYNECQLSCYPYYGAPFTKDVEQCKVSKCMPVLKECSASCNSQYAPKPTIVQKVVNVFKAAQYRNAKWICHDGTESVEGGDTSCKPSDTWSTYAKQACDGKCSTETNKCGVNSFMVYNEC